MPKPKVLLDTNIIASGLVFLSGNGHKVLKLAEEKRIVLVLPEFVVEEKRRVLARSFAGYEALLDVFLARVEYTSVPWEAVEPKPTRDGGSSQSAWPSSPSTPTWERGARAI